MTGKEIMKFLHSELSDFDAFTLCSNGSDAVVLIGHVTLDLVGGDGVQDNESPGIELTEEIDLDEEDGLEQAIKSLNERFQNILLGKITVTHS